MIGSAALMRRAVVEGVVYREGIIGAASRHCIDWDGTQAHGWNMTSYENFMNRFFADLAIHSPGQEIHYKPAQLEQTYHVPEIDIRECLPQWAHQGLIQLRAWDGHTSRHWNEWPDLDSFFFNQTDAGNVRVTLLAAGREHVELLKKNYRK